MMGDSEGLEPGVHAEHNALTKLKPIKIQHNTSAMSQLSINSFTDELFEDVFDENMVVENIDENLSEMNLEAVDLNSALSDKKNMSQVTLKSNSTCSSRSSHTDEEDNMDEEIPELVNEDTLDNNMDILLI